MTRKKRPVLYITGLSGAGISTALKALEDSGYEVFDNFPLSQIDSLVNEKGFETSAVAFGLDTRTRAFNPERIVDMRDETGGTLVVLNATNATLQKRFSETRRVHPMAKDRTVVDGIIHERDLLKPLFNAADRMIDTSDMSVHDLKRMIENDFSLSDKGERLAVTVMSFGFKKGVPREVDMVLDVRFLKNPHWDEKLRPLTGQDKAVQDYIRSDENFSVFEKMIARNLSWLLPRYAHEGKSYFTIAFGCTGGKHRSVFLAEIMAKEIQSLGYQTHIRHRDKPVSPPMP